MKEWYLKRMRRRQNPEKEKCHAWVALEQDNPQLLQWDPQQKLVDSWPNKLNTIIFKRACLLNQPVFDEEELNLW